MSPPTYNAFFGGSFNPPHLAHHEILKNLVADPLVAKVFLVPTSQNPLKIGLSSKTFDQEERAKWISLWLGTPELETLREKIFLETIEMQRPAGEASYTIDTLKTLKKKHSNSAPWVLIIGSDNVKTLPLWKDFKTLLRQFHSVWIYPRSGENFNTTDISDVVGELTTFRIMNLKLSEVSSTQIRVALEGPNALQEIKNLALLPAVKQRLLSLL